MMKTLITTTQARTNLYRLIDQVAQSHHPITITGKNNNAVLVSLEDWEAIQETLYLFSIPGLSESIIEGLNTPIDECDSDIEW